MNQVFRDHATQIIAAENFARAERVLICGESHIQDFAHDPSHDWAMTDGTILVLSGLAKDLEPILVSHSREIRPELEARTS